MTDIAITKEAAAQRQIDAAIRMLFLHGEDLFAIHTVAAAARQVALDVAKAKGISSHTAQTLEFGYRQAITAWMRSRETGEPLEEAHRVYLALVDRYIAQYEAAQGRKGTTVKLTDVEDPTIAAALAWKAQAIESDNRTHRYRNKAANFLKHADKDADQSLSVAQLDVLWVIAHACELWIEMNMPVTDEMLVFNLWFCAVTGDPVEGFGATKAGQVDQFTFPQQIEFGRYLLKDVLKRARRSTRWFRDDRGHEVGWLATPRMVTSL